MAGRRPVGWGRVAKLAVDSGQHAIEVAVDFLTWLLTETADAEYPRDSDWYIYDPSLHSRWLPPGREFSYPEPP